MRSRSNKRAASTPSCWTKRARSHSGQPQVVELLPSRDTDARQLLATAAAAEKLSGHPLAAAVVAAAESQGIAADRAEALEIVPGHGIVCRLRGRECRRRNRTACWPRHAVNLDPLDRDAVERERGRRTNRAAGGRKRPLLGTILVADPPAPHSADAVAGLQRVPLKSSCSPATSRRLPKPSPGRWVLRECWPKCIRPTNSAIVEESAARRATPWPWWGTASMTPRRS